MLAYVFTKAKFNISKISKNIKMPFVFLVFK